MAITAGNSYTGEELRSQGFNPDITGGTTQVVNGVTYRLWNDEGKRRVEQIGAGQASQLEADEQLKKEISDIVTELDAKLSDTRLGLTDEERDAFLAKAIEQVKPYYDKKRGEIEKGISTGKIRDAEDVLASIRTVREDTESLLSKYDIDRAETEEELVNTLSDITATKDESLDAKKAEWTERIRNVKMGQVQTGTLTSGIGRGRVGELLGRETAEKEAIERRAGAAETETQTAAKYDLQKIALARKSAEQERVRKIGAPGQEAATTQAALGTAGLAGMGELPSLAEMARRRGAEPTTIYRPEALTELTEEQRRAGEAQAMEFETEEKAIRASEYDILKKKTLADLAKQYSSTALATGSRFY